jgi:hypothetical protein
MHGQLLACLRLFILRGATITCAGVADRTGLTCLIMYCECRCLHAAALTLVPTLLLLLPLLLLLLPLLLISTAPVFCWGPGEHPTTAMCLRQLMAWGGEGLRGARVMDYGAGSGVLGITGEMQGRGERGEEGGVLALFGNRKACWGTGTRANGTGHVTAGRMLPPFVPLGLHKT